MATCWKKTAKTNRGRQPSLYTPSLNMPLRLEVPNKSVERLAIQIPPTTYYCLNWFQRPHAMTHAERQDGWSGPETCKIVHDADVINTLRVSNQIECLCFIGRGRKLKGAGSGLTVLQTCRHSAKWWLATSVVVCIVRSAEFQANSVRITEAKCPRPFYRQFSPAHCHSVITAGTLVPSSVNGDIAIQWEWSNFDPSQNPNPLTDYDKTLQFDTYRQCHAA